MFKKNLTATKNKRATLTDAACNMQSNQLLRLYNKCSGVKVCEWKLQAAENGDQIHH